MNSGMVWEMKATMSLSSQAAEPKHCSGWSRLEFTVEASIIENLSAVEVGGDRRILQHELELCYI